MFQYFLFFLCYLPYIFSQNNTIITFNNKRLPNPVEFIPSGCHSDILSDKYGFHCPHMFMNTDDMIKAQEYDNLPYLYVTAGSFSDTECGKCYVIKIMEDNYPILLLQVINSGGDIQRGQFDIMIPAGGFGYYNACTKDCKENYCNGGPCLKNIYHGNFQDWNNEQSSCYKGGIRWNKEDGIYSLFTLCSKLIIDKKKLKNKITFDSCIRTNIAGFYRNFQSIQYSRVQCPRGLISITGIQREDDIDYPYPSDSIELNQYCNSDTCITTMNDCCKPSCAWKKEFTKKEWDRVYTCNEKGEIYI